MNSAPLQPFPSLRDLPDRHKSGRSGCSKSQNLKLVVQIFYPLETDEPNLTYNPGWPPPLHIPPLLSPPPHIPRRGGGEGGRGVLGGRGLGISIAGVTWRRDVTKKYLKLSFFDNIQYFLLICDEKRYSLFFGKI